MIGGKYIPIIELGRGGLSRVFLVYNTKNREYNAMKIQVKTRFSNRELEIYSMFINCNYIQQLTDYVIDDEKYTYIVTSVATTNLFNVIRRTNTSLHRLNEALLQTLKGLEQMHMRDITHGDIKAENILVYNGPNNRVTNAIKIFNELLKDNNTNVSSIKRCIKDIVEIHRPLTRVDVRLCDFGTSFYGIKKNKCLYQSLYYRAPEVILDGVKGKDLDIWSIGCLVFEIYTKRTLFYFEVENDPPEVHNLCIDKKHCSQIESLLGKNPLNKSINTYVVHQYRVGLTEYFMSRVLTECENKDVVLDFLQKTLRYKNRITIQECISHELFKTINE